MTDFLMQHCGWFMAGAFACAMVFVFCFGMSLKQKDNPAYNACYEDAMRRFRKLAYLALVPAVFCLGCVGYAWSEYGVRVEAALKAGELVEAQVLATCFMDEARLRKIGHAMLERNDAEAAAKLFLQVRMSPKDMLAYGEKLKPETALRYYAALGRTDPAVQEVIDLLPRLESAAHGIAKDCAALALARELNERLPLLAAIGRKLEANGFPEMAKAMAFQAATEMRIVVAADEERKKH